MKAAQILTVTLATLALAACVSAPPSRPPVSQQTAPPPRPSVTQPVPPTQSLPPPVAGFQQPEILRERGLDAVIQQNSASLQRRFGPPRLSTVEGDMLKLQFGGEACVLDVFLYPLSPGAEPVATWVEARRRSDGAEVDRGACAAALAR